MMKNGISKVHSWFEPWNLKSYPPKPRFQHRKHFGSGLWPGWWSSSRSRPWNSSNGSGSVLKFNLASEWATQLNLIWVIVLRKYVHHWGNISFQKKNLFNLRTLRLTKARRRTMRLGVWKHIVFDCVELSPNSKDAKQVIQRTCKTTVFEKQTSMKSCLWRFCDNQTLYQKQFASEFLSSCTLTRLRLFVNPFLSNWKWVS